MFPLIEIKTLIDYLRGQGSHTHKDAYFAALTVLRFAGEQVFGPQAFGASEHPKITSPEALAQVLQYEVEAHESGVVRGGGIWLTIAVALAKIVMEKLLTR